MSARSSRASRAGASLIAVGTLQFVGAMVAVQLAYPGYSDLSNYISDLGNTSTSPWHLVFNLSIGVLGLFALVGIAAAWGSFPPGATRAVGLPLLMVAGIAAILVGVFPENVNPTVHGLVSLLVFLPGGLALVVLGVGMGAGSGWAGGRGYSYLLGAITLASLAFFVPDGMTSSPWYPGFVERLIVFPVLLWALGVAVHLLRLPREMPSPVVPRPSPG